MLSILIPTYNFSSYSLVKELNKQCIETNIEFEIICIDDGSLSPLNIENQNINNLSQCKFIESKINLGLSNIRNDLAKKSTYKNILFIDGDSELIDDSFIKRYLSALKNNPDVIYGGRIHTVLIDTKRSLRWKYGKYREDLSVYRRNKNIYKSVLFNNTLIKKKVFNKIGFEKNITQYGHEDTIFAYKLSLINATVIHIDNPVKHADIDLNQVYLEKTRKGLQNLNFIYNTDMVDPNFITLLRLFNQLKKIGLHYFFSYVYKIFHPFLVKNLTSKKPSLYIFDLFRLSYFCFINLNK
ncbi:glycosyltransferase family 2 protein [Yeosuana marina]|uniref:glycosyltransferase family 2 protein n=1 Tax=Yeosuana marina TaxID=1565536 RepID=UPI0030C8A3D6